MAKITNISGFPEWLPEHKLLEDQIIAKIRRVYESVGYTPIETPSVELMTTLTSKGVVAKEIFAVRRAQDDGEREAELGLHFDLTVPFARYVAQHLSDLTFPFRRYQLQRVWRGERPQRGREREFYQFDLDVVCRETLPLALDAEVLSTVNRAWQTLAVAPFIIYLNNRKVLCGLYAALGLSDEAQRAAVVAVDKLKKIGPDGVIKELLEVARCDRTQAEKIIALSGVSGPLREAHAMLSGLGLSGKVFEAGCEELHALTALLPADACSHIVLDLSLARGLDYYTGAIFEVHFPDHPEYGSMGGGGRYDNLASAFSSQKLPGVGATIGLTRLMDLVVEKGLLPATRRTVSDLVVAVYNEEQRPECNRYADELREGGACVEVFPSAPKLGKQIEYAEKKGVRYVLFVGEGGGVEIKDLITKEQSKVGDLAAWWGEISKR